MMHESNYWSVSERHQKHLNPSAHWTNKIKKVGDANVVAPRTQEHLKFAGIVSMPFDAR